MPYVNDPIAPAGPTDLAELQASVPVETALGAVHQPPPLSHKAPAPAEKPTARVPSPTAAAKAERVVRVSSDSESNLATGIMGAFKEWYREQGVYLTFSAVVHATILLVALVLLASFGLVPEQLHSVAPVFSGDFKTDFPSEEMQAFDSSEVNVGAVENASSVPALEANQSDAIADVANMINTTGPTSGSGGEGSDLGGAVGFGSNSTMEGIGGMQGFGGGGGGGTELRSLRAQELLTASGSGGGRSSAKHGGVTQAGGAGDAVDGILGGIRGKLEEGDLLVCWLVDGSISILPDRQIIAERIEPFFREIEQRSKDSYRLMNAVVAFGSTTREIIGPTKFTIKIPEAIRAMPVDPTGIENTMSAVEACVEQYRRRWKGGMLLVLWTDESGDDILRLEEIIALCRKRRVVVRIVGPSAVLGSERGTHYYVDKGSGYAFYLPVKRGPDTALPEKLAVPYWHDGALPPWSSSDGAQVAQGMPWYGGPHREGLLSGIGPYALTRLALETGGVFTLLDHKEDQSGFKLDKMRRYLPDYESAADYMAMLEKYPLRKAVSHAVARTYVKINMVPPVMSFVISRSDRYPYQIIGGYQSPATFRQGLMSELPRQEQLAQAASQVIEEALAIFGKEGMEEQYFLERSPRWRAWYDVTRGRLLAMSVRHLEYLLTLQQIKTGGYLAPDTNRIELRPVAKYKAGKMIEERAVEASRLLQRCAKENADTPWNFLAKWELDHALGLEVKQIVIPMPKPSPSGGRPGPPSTPPPPAPKIYLPTL